MLCDYGTTWCGVKLFTLHQRADKHHFYFSDNNTLIGGFNGFCICSGQGPVHIVEYVETIKKRKGIYPPVLVAAMLASVCQVLFDPQ